MSRRWRVRLPQQGRVACAEAMAAVSSLASKLLDQSLGVPQRFRVLFSLRGVGTPEAADALLAGA